MRRIDRVMWLVLFGLTVLSTQSGPAAAQQLQDMAAQGPVFVLEDVLVLPRVGQYGRAAIHTDAIEAMMVASTFRTPAAGDSVELPDGSTREWANASAGEDGWLNHQALRGGYVHWTIESRTVRLAMLNASGHSSVYVNGELRAGDPYANGWVTVPLYLRAGRNEFLFHVSRGRLRAQLDLPKSPAFFEVREPTMPDLIRGEDEPVCGSVIIVNANRVPMKELTIIAGGGDLPVRETPVPHIPPLTIRKVPFWFGGAPPEQDSCIVPIQLVFGPEGQRRALDSTELNVNVRSATDRHKRTFISEVDGSVQYYAVTPMRASQETEPAARPALILTLHGAGVEGAGQAAVYGQKGWAHVVAPTNRRPYGFDWEDWGRLDAMEVLNDAESRFSTDPLRTYLTGHSMGGHGAWQVGVTFPDRFAAIAPSAGWISFWSYTGAARYEADDPIEQILARATSSSDTLGLSRNFLQYGIYILHGERDDNVPVGQARQMRKHLAEYHADFCYYERPNAGHWWGNGCCDWPPLISFLQDHARIPTPDVRHIEFVTANPEVSATSDWVSIEQQVSSLAFSSVKLDYAPASAKIANDEGAITNARVSGTTENVRRLRLSLADLNPGEAIDIALDEQQLDAVPVSSASEGLWLTRGADGAWTASREAPSPAEKSPRRSGPFKNAFRNRMALVYGTQGTQAEQAWAYAKARYDAETFWYRGNGSVDCVPDIEFDADAEPDRNIILYGNADTNAAWDALLADSPVQVQRGAVKIDDRRWIGQEFGCLFIRPRPGSDVASVGVVAGTGPVGMRVTDRLPYFVSGVAYPDCFVVTPEILRDGIAGVKAAGFFGSDWSALHGEFAFSDD